MLYFVIYILALITSIFILLHIVWSIIAFGAFEKKETLLVAGVVLSHIISSQAVSLIIYKTIFLFLFLI